MRYVRESCTYRTAFFTSARSTAISTRQHARKDLVVVTWPRHGKAHLLEGSSAAGERLTEARRDLLRVVPEGSATPRTKNEAIARLHISQSSFYAYYMGRKSFVND